MLWSWNQTDSETWTHGTFNTKEEAIQDALGCRKWLENKLSDLMFEFHQKIGLNSGWFKVVDMEEINLNDYEEKVISNVEM